MRICKYCVKELIKENCKNGTDEALIDDLASLVTSFPDSVNINKIDQILKYIIEFPRVLHSKLQQVELVYRDDSSEDHIYNLNGKVFAIRTEYSSYRSFTFSTQPIRSTEKVTRQVTSYV